MNTRKDWNGIYSVSTASSSAGLVCSAWLQVTLGMVATTTSVHSTSPFSCGNWGYAKVNWVYTVQASLTRQDFSVIVVGSTFWTG